MTYPLSQTETYGYDNYNMTAKTDRNETKFTYGYDGMKRLTSANAVTKNGQTAPEHMTWTYYKTGALASENVFSF